MSSVDDEIDGIVETLAGIKSKIKNLISPVPLIPQPVPILPQYWIDFLSKIKIIVYGETTFTRTIDFASPYVKLFHSEQVSPTLSMMLIGIEDRDDGGKPDGWTDILLPIFYGPAENACKLPDESLFFVDSALSGAYKKELWFFVKGKWKLLFTYSVSNGLCWYDTTIKTSCGYIEYCPSLDTLCNFVE